MSAYKKDKVASKEKAAGGKDKSKEKFCSYCRGLGFYGRGHTEAECKKKKAGVTTTTTKEQLEKKEASSGAVFVVNAVSAETPAVSELVRLNLAAKADIGDAAVSGALDRVLADTGSAVNLVPTGVVRSWKRSSGKPGRYQLQPADAKIRAANGSPITIHGKLSVELEWQGRKCVAPFYEADVGTPIIGLAVCRALGVFAGGADGPAQVSAMEQVEGVKSAAATAAGKRAADRGLVLEKMSSAQLMELYDEVFDDKAEALTTMDTAPMRIELKQDARPFCVTAPRPVPLPVLQRLKEAIEDMLRRGVIRVVPATEPTEWCSPLHYVLKKDGSIHVVNDLRQLNMATKRPAYPMTTAKAAVGTPIIGLAVCRALGVFAGGADGPAQVSAMEQVEGVKSAAATAARKRAADRGLVLEKMSSAQLMELYDEVFDDKAEALTTMDTAPDEDRAEAGRQAVLRDGAAAGAAPGPPEAQGGHRGHAAKGGSSEWSPRRSRPSGAPPSTTC